MLDNNNMRMIPLLMTSSVSTRGMKGACFSDEERESMYVNALQFYIDTFKYSNQEIVFADNSGWDLDRIKQRLSTHGAGNIEFIALPQFF